MVSLCEVTYEIEPVVVLVMKLPKYRSLRLTVRTLKTPSNGIDREEFGNDSALECKSLV
jgi:hypothetical protein